MLDVSILQLKGVYVVAVQSLSCVQLFATPWTVALKASPFMEFSRQKYWSGYPFSSLGSSQSRDQTCISGIAAKIPFFFLILLKDNCFTEFCYFLSNPNMNQPYIYICPLSLELPSHPPPHPTPLGHHTVPHLGFLHQTASPTGYSLHMVEYVLQCYSLKPCHPLLPALCPKVCSSMYLSTLVQVVYIVGGK